MVPRAVGPKAGARGAAGRAALLFAAIGGSVGAGRAQAADRPSEDQLFGGAPAASPPGTPKNGGAPSEPAAAGGAAAAGTGVGTGGADGTSTGGAATSVAPAPNRTDATASGAAAASPISPPTPEDRSAARDASMLGDPNAGPKLSEDVAPEDPLKVG